MTPTGEGATAVTELQGRRAEEGDAAGIAALLPALGYAAALPDVRDRLGRLLRTRHAAVFVAQSVGGIVGLCHVSGVVNLATGGYAEVLELVVASPSRSRGVGRALVSQASEWARDAGFRRLRLRSGVHRGDAHAFYERLGFARSSASHAFEAALEPPLHASGDPR